MFRNRLLIIPLLLLSLTGCASRSKPELKPQIYTSAPIATNLRTSTVPEGMFPYDSLPAMKKARLDQDPNLGEINAVPILSPVPDGLKPAYRANPDEVLVEYQDELAKRTIRVYGFFTEEPSSLLEEHIQETYFHNTTIAGRSFYILAEYNPDQEREAYTLEGQWFIHVFASGIEEDEFKRLLGTLKLSSLD